MSADERCIIWPEHAQGKALRAIAQFLETVGLKNTLEAMQKEARWEKDKDKELQQDVLLRALQLWEDAQNQRDLDVEREWLGVLQGESPMEAKGVDQVVRTLNTDEVHSKNLLGVRIQPGSVIWVEEAQKVAVLSADCTVSLFDVHSLQVEHRLKLDSAPISSHFNPKQANLLAVGCMNGSHSILDLQRFAILQQCDEHQNKHVLRCRWSWDGTRLATCGRDKTVSVYGWNGEQLDLKKTLRFAGVPEALEWFPQESALVVAVRGDFQLHLFDEETLRPKSDIMLNTHADSYVSFTVLDLAVSRSHKFIFSTTDANRAVLVHPEAKRPVMDYYGALNEEYSTPRTSFGEGDLIVYSTSQDASLVSWDLRSATRHCSRFQAQHTKQIRGLDYDASNNVLATCSYDMTVKLWKPSS